MTHVGFIMDGNRRWAREQGIPEIRQHEHGAKNLMHVVELCHARALDVVSFWALAVKNIEERSKTELDALYGLLKREVKKMVPRLKEYNIVFDFIGDMSLLPDDVARVLVSARDETQSHTGMTCVLAIAYGGQREIVQGIRRALIDGVDPESLDEKLFTRDYIDSGRFPPPDLIVRTGADARLRTSGFLLWGSEYSEFHFTKTFWPAFDERELDRALATLDTAQRNFGS